MRVLFGKRIAWPYSSGKPGQSIHPLAGKSLLIVLTQGTRPQHPYMHWEHENMRAIRTGNWKAIGVIGKPWELYDLTTDLVRQLEQQWTQWANTHHVFPKGTMKTDFPNEWNFVKTAK